MCIRDSTHTHCSESWANSLILKSPLKFPQGRGLSKNICCLSIWLSFSPTLYVQTHCSIFYNSFNGTHRLPVINNNKIYTAVVYNNRSCHIMSHRFPGQKLQYKTDSMDHFFQYPVHFILIRHQQCQNLDQSVVCLINTTL